MASSITTTNGAVFAQGANHGVGRVVTGNGGTRSGSLSFHFRRPSFSSYSSKTLHVPASSNQLLLSTRISSSFVASSSSTVSVPHPSAFDVGDEISRLETLRTRLSQAGTLRDKLSVLDGDRLVQDFFNSSTGEALRSFNLKPSEVYLLKCVVAARQEHVLYHEHVGQLNSSYGGGSNSEMSALKAAFFTLLEMIEKGEVSGGHGSRVRMDATVASMKKLLSTLEEVESFYDCIGGIIGYQIVVLQLLLASNSSARISSLTCKEDANSGNRKYYVPAGVDLLKDAEYASQAALWGIEALPELGEIYPLGGSGDRLGLTDPETGECLPAAMLPYCGRTLLEGLIRDLQAREFLYFKKFGRQCITPVAIMTSSAKNNHERIKALCKEKGWFGRGENSFFLFEQPQVPVVDAEDAQWLVHGPFSPVLKPGGHGVIWKLAWQKGVFDWFYSHDRKGATVRQVSNVVAATDVTLLALAGIGHRHKKKLGFASCERSSAATEGINVLIEQKEADSSWSYCITCIEYTEFDKLGITDSPLSPSGLQANFPANTNILYIDLTSVEKIVSSERSACLPGLVLNLKKRISFRDHLGFLHSVQGGRLECTMQNIADYCSNRFPLQNLGMTEGKLHLPLTPDGALLDIMRNAYDILSSCNIKMPEVADNVHYLHSVPPFLILLHPALGPLWEVTRQKFQGGSIAQGSELQIEVAEFLWKNVELDGSLTIVAENIMGSTSSAESGSSLIRYGYRCGRCKLQNVKIVNKGIDWNNADNSFWRHDVKRFETMRVTLLGNAEFEAVDVVLEGNHVYEVPSGYKLLVTNGNSGVSTRLVPIQKEMMDCGSWFWKYNRNKSHITLEMVEM
ncbi:hypothetical protein EJ110_NYTH24223 [Nymphaea thermarum]|nr:hypothetical protein EJ110_NYTH24223 [Nymphaea thermarum]